MVVTILLKLLVAHLIGDFLFQPDSWVRDKRKKKAKSVYLYFHIGVHFISLLILFQGQYLVSIAIVVVTHYLIDLLKLYNTQKNNKPFLFIADQIAHLAVIIAVAYGIQAFTVDINMIFSDGNLLLAGFLILVSFTSSVLIKMVIAPWDKKLNIDTNSIDGAGKYIGILERLFVFSFVLLGTWSAIGFLITAKSVFRFGDLNEGKNRKLTEYVLIGTLLSFGLAILSGLLYNYFVEFIK